MLPNVVMQFLGNIPQLDVTERSEMLAVELVRKLRMSGKAEVDALHIAVATVHGMDFLMTWNCTHIANAALRPQIETVCRNYG